MSSKRKQTPARLIEISELIDLHYPKYFKLSDKLKNQLLDIFLKAEIDDEEIIKFIDNLIINIQINNLLNK